MLTSSEETLRHDGGPLEKNHLKDMVQRNALETLVFNKITKHIETEKKAFTRQNSRDETEMKHLMLRLHQEQQAFIQNGEQLSSESGEELEDEITNEPKEPDRYVNPYPVTIIPKFGAPQTKPVAKQGSAKILADLRDNVEESEDVHGNQQLHVTSLSSSNMRPRDQKGEWLGNPEAISSVRRPRKSVSNQIQRLALNRSHSEQNVLGDFTMTSSPVSMMLSPRDRSNSFTSLKENKVDGDEIRAGALNKRGGSLKERPKKSTEQTKQPTKPLARSYSMLSKASLQELQTKCGAFGKLHVPEGKSKMAHQEDIDKVPGTRNWRKTKHGSLKEKKDKGTSSIDFTQEKQPLSRKSSNEGEPSGSVGNQKVPVRKNSLKNKQTGEPVDNYTDIQGKLKNHQATYITSASVGFSNSLDENVLRTALGPKRKQTYHPNRLSPHASPDASPNMSPLAREKPVFKY